MPTYPLDRARGYRDNARMFLRMETRTKDGKTHRYWSVVENRRVGGGRVVQRQALYRGELNDAQHAGWVRAIEAFEDKRPAGRQMALFPDDRQAPEGLACEAVAIRVGQIRLVRPRQWGACWLAMRLWEMLDLERFWEPLLGPSRKGTRWLSVLKALVA